MRYFVSELVYGYESHDEYFEIGRMSVQCSDDAWTFGHAEEELNELAEWLVEGEWSGWWRIETIERIVEEEAA